MCSAKALRPSAFSDFRKLTRGNILDTCADSHADGAELVRVKIGKDIFRSGLGKAERASVLLPYGGGPLHVIK
jgi:hypothetical protein